MKYQLLDNNRPAQYPNCAVHHSWNKSTFDTIEDCVLYAIKWLNYGEFSISEQKQLETNLVNGYDYSGYGDILRIIPLDN